MRIDIMTLFPAMMQDAFSHSIIARGTKAGYIDIHYHQIRDYSANKQRKVDDTPYGGGPGMVMTYQPIVDTHKHILSQLPEETKPYCIYMSPQGKVLNQKIAKRLSKEKNLVILCGHYEGVDERVLDEIIDEEISIGDYVLTGGELPACVTVDCIVRLIPGVLGSDKASQDESHWENLLEYPQYTKPSDINGRKVPDVLLSGNHQDIDKWRLEESKKRTKTKRPDMITDIYLDNSATTRQNPSVTEEMLRIANYFYGNPSSLHNLGLKAEIKLREARKTIAGLLDANENEIHFTSGGSESNNWALRGVLEAYTRLTGQIIVSEGEHPSVLETAAYLERSGRKVVKCPLRSNGVPHIEALKELMTEDTAVISMLHVNSETGAITPLEEMVNVCRNINPQVIIHVDCVQSFGKLPVIPEKLGIDMISASAHKIHGPRGIGFLYIRKGLRITPLIFGGGQENNLRSGTENLPGIIGLAKAAEYMYSAMDKNYQNAIKLNKKFREYIQDHFNRAIIISDENYCSPYILNVAFPGIKAEVLLHSLEEKEVYISVGSACSSRKKNRSHVLTAMGYRTDIIDGAIRISFCPENTELEVDRASQALGECIKILNRKMSHSI